MSVSWHDIVYYDPLSPVGLRWAIDTQNKKANDLAGSGKVGSYSKVQYSGERVSCHVVVWMPENNTSGVVGVYFCNKRPAWQAYWTPPGKRQRGKSFSVNKYGYEQAFHLACEHRAAMIEELNQHGDGYTTRHGT